MKDGATRGASDISKCSICNFNSSLSGLGFRDIRLIMVVVNCLNLNGLLSALAYPWSEAATI
jgi:hypothetical protein